MGRNRSLRIQTEVDEAGRAHNCKSNDQHRIERGDRRLKVRTKGFWNHYCLDCARKMVRRDIEEFEALAEELDRDP